MKSLRKLWRKLKPTFPLIILAVFLATFYFLLMTNLGRDYLFNWDEGIYAELGREMLATKNLFVTFWNGSPWFEKPPAIAWFSALGIAIAGPTAYGARLFMPLFAVYTLFIVYYLGKYLGSWRHGLLAAGLLASLSLFLQRTRAVNVDMPILAGIATTVLFLLEKRPAWWVALAIAASVWFKGPAGLLSVIIALPLFLTRTKKYWLQTVLYSLLFILPWHLYAYLLYGKSFYQPYLLEQVFQRASTQIEFHFETRWYYFIYLYQNLGVGVLTVLAVGIASAVYNLFRSKERVLYFTLLWWLLIPLAIFTLAKTRLFWYILPIYPAIALLLTEAIGRFAKTKTAKAVLAVLAVGVLCQALLQASRSVEIAKKVVEPPDDLNVAMSMSQLGRGDLAVLVPPQERTNLAILPEAARLSSSFRYGGMPSVVYYYTAGHVNFFYDVDAFRNFLATHDVSAMISSQDASIIPSGYHTAVTTPTYLGIKKGIYALER